MKRFKSIIALIITTLLVISVFIGTSLWATTHELKTTSSKLHQLEQQTQQLSDQVSKSAKENENLKQQIKELSDEKATLENENKRLQDERNAIQQQLNEKSTITKPISNSGVSNMPTDKTVYLTFDDGPSKNSPLVLDILKKYNVKATFFVNGNKTDFGKSIYNRIVNEGHAIGNHTYSHNYKTVYSSTDSFIADVNKLNELLVSTTGVKPDIIRFPGGSNNHVSWKYSGKDFMPKLTQRMLEEGYEYFDWNVSSCDAESVTPSKQSIYDAVFRNLGSYKSAIILFHDSAAKTTTVEALPGIIEKLQAMRYKFEVLENGAYTIHF